MYADRPQYEIYTYFGDRIVSQISRQVEERCDAEMIEWVRKRQQSDHEAPIDYDSHVDLFYCDAHEIGLIGTWVSSKGKLGWHANGWEDRPTPSKEKALRSLHERSRPI